MKFQVGKTYATRSIVDSASFVTVQIISRTEKTIKAITQFGEKTLRITVHGGIETVKPWGSYSMAPMVRANVESQVAG